MKKQFIALFLAAAWATAPAQADQAETDFPTQTVSITVPYTPGGTTDFLARKLAEEMTKVLDQPVIVENRPGAGTTVAAAHIARQPADGHHLLVASNATLAINPYLDIPQNYSPEDFEPISLLVGVPNVIVSKSGTGKESLADWFTAAQQGEQFTYGSMGVGTSNQIGMEVLLDTTDTDIAHVPYQGSAPALNDLLGGHVDLVVDTLVATAPHIKAGKMDGLAVLSAQRPSLIDIPTAKEAVGVDVDLYSWFGLVAPKGTPQEIIDALNQVVTDALRDDGLKKSLEDAGVEIIGSGADEFREFITEQHAMYGELIEKHEVEIGN